MKLNRVWLVSVAILMASVYYEVRLRPQSRPLYERARILYRQEHYAASLEELARAYKIEPNNTDILVLMGWNQLKLGRREEARENFSRATRLNSNLQEAKLGLIYAALETGQGEASSLREALQFLQLEPNNPDFQLAAATAFRQAGKNREAAVLFRGLLGRDRYGVLARKNLQEMYGLGDAEETLPEELPPLQRPRILQVLFRASGQYLQRWNRNSWEKFYVRGVNIGPATPGHFASDPPPGVEEYLRWLEHIGALGANTVRAYTILPPAFYRALKKHNENPNQPKLYLLQEIWLADTSDTNLFLPATVTASQQEIRWALDVIHGQGDLPMRPGRAGGLYGADVSDSVIGLLVGRELEPHLVQANNKANPEHTSYGGKYISIPEGNATESWLASLMDYAASYEVQQYNQQRPLSIVNWPPLDPLPHPTEAGLAEELNFRRRMGEKLGELPAVYDDNDAVSVDSTRLRTESVFQAGLFASYHVYPFYPDFLLHDPGLLRARDQAGPNSYFGYLQALKAHYANMPLLIAEYGVSTSIGVSHFHPYGWNHGGLNERQQGELLARLTRNIADAGCAGGIVFEWQDEWFKTNWLTTPLEIPFDRRALWQNALNPEENFGLWTYEPSQSRLFSADSSAWKNIRRLYEKSGERPAVMLSDGADSQRTLRNLAVSSDEAYLYLRLGVASLPRRPDGTPQLEKANFLIGISTRPGHFGSRILPLIFPQLRYPEGFNFLLHVAGPGKTRLLVASNYNPYRLFESEAKGQPMLLQFRSSWEPVLEDWSPFEDIVVETNRMRFSRNGTTFPPQRYSRGLLRYGPLDPNRPEYDSLATWAADFDNNALVFRLPWALLLATDPSSRHVYAGSEAGGQLRSATTDGIAVVALSFRPPQEAVDWSRFPSTSLPATDSLPGVNRQGLFTEVIPYRWKGWDSVQVSGRLKASVAALQKSFLDLKGRGL